MTERKATDGFSSKEKKLFDEMLVIFDQFTEVYVATLR